MTTLEYGQKIKHNTQARSKFAKKDRSDNEVNWQPFEFLNLDKVLLPVNGLGIYLVKTQK